jgi:hypothetical protein
VRVVHADARDETLTGTSAHKLISAVVCDAEKNFVAAGIENPDDGPGVSPVYVWYALQPYILRMC